MQELVFSPSDFVAVLNQTLESAYPGVTIQGELANFRVSKNKWVYFDLKDEYSSVKFFGTIYQLTGPLEDGLMLQVRGIPRLHQAYGFSINVQSMRPVGEGSLRKAVALLEAKLTAEGLFESYRKRALPYPPERIGLIASSESAAYHDFIKILNSRWGGVMIELADVQVQGDAAIGQIVRAIDYFNQHAKMPEILVITRGGGSTEDLAVFSTEQVTRAIAGSRVPTMVAIGHEVDLSLAELVADRRASTPSNAAELLVPDKKHERQRVITQQRSLDDYLSYLMKNAREAVKNYQKELQVGWKEYITNAKRTLSLHRQVLAVLDPDTVLKRGYAIVRSSNGVVLRSIKQVEAGDTLNVVISDGSFEARV